MTAETVLLRVKRRGEQWLDRPGIRETVRFVGYFAGNLILSRLELWGKPTPGAMSFAAACTGWRRVAAAAGGLCGYLLFWGNDGLRGVVWLLGSLLLAMIVRLVKTGQRQRFCLAAGCGVLVSGTELAFGMVDGPQLLFLRAAVAGAGVLLWESAMAGKNFLSRWFGFGLGVMALTQISPWLGPLATGFVSAQSPLPVALAAALGADLGGSGMLPMTVVAVLSFYLRRLFPRGAWRSIGAPTLAVGILMVIGRYWTPEPWAAVSLGACVGALIPWRMAAPPRRGSVGAAQVRLEQMSGIFTGFQQQLLESAPPPPDIPALTQRLKRNACGSCALRTGCVEQNRLTEALLTGDEGFQCRKSVQAESELRRSREQLRRIRADRARQEEYRLALVQQYGFLADTLRELSDHLPERIRGRTPRYRVQVSARSRGKAIADGDRISAFPGLECRYYVLLCDGMGTGLGAAEESRRATELIRRMLTAGMSPSAVLGSLNSQLTLMDRGGAVTVDLAELRLDTGRVWLYKWGAGPSWLLRRRRGIRVGTSGPPPGLGVAAGREAVHRVVLFPGDCLVLLSDGVNPGNVQAWASMARQKEPGDLAASILASSAQRDDDATAAVIRLLPHASSE